MSHNKIDDQPTYSSIVAVSSPELISAITTDCIKNLSAQGKLHLDLLNLKEKEIRMI